MVCAGLIGGVLGAATSLAFTLAVAVMIERRPASAQPQATPLGRVQHPRWPVECEVWRTSGFGYDVVSIGESSEFLGIARAPLPIPVVGAALPAWVMPLRRDDNFVRTIAYGWPLRCMRTRFASGTGAAGTIEGRLVRIPWVSSTYLRLPTSVIPVGLAGNAAVFGGAWYTVFLLLRWRRRRRRALAGCCHLCEYDLRGLDGSRCPECGRLEGVRL